MGLTYFDYIVLLIFAISIIFGIYKGFISSAGSILVTICAWVGALLFTDDLALLIQQKTNILEEIIYYVQADETIADLTLRKTSIFSLSTSAIEEAVQASSLPEFFKPHILQNISNGVFDAVDTLGDYFDYTVGSVILNIMCFFVILAGVALIVSIIKAGLEAIVKLPALKYVDGLLGAGFGALRGLFLVYAFFMIIPVILLLVPESIITEYLGNVSDSPIASVFYDNNILLKYIGSFIKLT